MGWKSSVLILAATCGPAAGAQFGESNLVLLQVGDGSGISRVAAPVFLKELTKAGFDVQAISVPTTTAGMNRRLTMDGVGTSEGFLRRSFNQEHLVFCGYDAALGTSAIATTRSSEVPRLVAVVNSSAAIETSTVLSDAYSAGPIRAAELQGNGLWISGASGASDPQTGGLRYTTRNGTVSAQVVSSPTLVRIPVIFGGQLYMSSSDSAFSGIWSVGTGTPMTGPHSPFGLLGIAGSNLVAADFVFADPQTIYIADDRNIASGGGIQKWTYNGTQWGHAYTLSSGLSAAVRRLVLEEVGGSRVIYALTAEAKANSLVKTTDLGPGSTFTYLKTASSETAYRGVSLTPKRSGVPIAVTNYALVRGAEFQGQLASLWEADGDLLDVFSDDTSLDAEVEVLGISPSSSGSQLRLECEYWVQRQGLGLGIQFYNVVTRRFQSVGGSIASTAYTLVSVSSSTVPLFIEEGGLVRARLRWAPINDEDPAQDGWLHRLDRIEWMLVP